MRIHEFVDEGLGHSSYVIDLSNGTVAIVDPPRFPIAHERVAGALGLEIAWTIDTHSHADYVTGSPGLVARRGAAFVAPAALPTLAALTPDDVERHLAAGWVVVDARPAGAFAVGHVPGSLSNTLRPVFASWLGWLVDPNQQLVFVLERDQDRADLVRQCLDVGHEHLVGELAGGIDAWTGSGRPVNMIPFIDVAAMRGAVIDVRQANEYATGHIPGARNVELGRIAMVEPTRGPVTVTCGHGERAMTGASLLVAQGHPDVVVLDGGPDTWSSATGRPLTVGE